MKRRKDKRQITPSSSFRLNRSTSPYFKMAERLNPECGGQLSRFAYPLEVDTSPPPLSAPPTFVPFNGRDRSISSCSLNYRGSPYDLSVLSPDLYPPRRNSDPSAILMNASPYSFPVAAYFPSPTNADYEDQPLDFSKKSRQTSESEYQYQADSAVGSSGSSMNSISSITKQQSRPSVITCASTHCGPRSAPLKHDCQNSTSHSSYHRDSSSQSASSSPSPGSMQSPSTSILNKCLTSSSRPSLMTGNAISLIKRNGIDGEKAKMPDEVASSKKLLLLREDCGSGIDEHFRRSLGEHYTGYTDVSMSVDDHFTKALGETWLKLKNASTSSS